MRNTMIGVDYPYFLLAALFYRLKQRAFTECNDQAKAYAGEIG